MIHHPQKPHHVYCLATIVYNVLVIVAEIVLQLFFTTHEIHEVLSFEIKIQLFHIIGVILLGVLQWWIIHRIKKQTLGVFTGVSFLMILVHMFVLHILPRAWGIIVEEHNHSMEVRETIILLFIILFVTLLFWKREYWLEKYGLKNKRYVKLPKIRL